MNRTECEKRIVEEFEKIVEIYHQYHPVGNYLDMVYTAQDGVCSIMAHNEHWHGGPDAERVIDVSKDLDTGEYR